MVNDIDSLISLSDVLLLVYTSASDFRVLTLYPATLLNLLISSSNFRIVSFEFSMYSIMLSANSDFSKVTGYKINTQKSLALHILTIKNQKEKLRDQYHSPLQQKE